MSTTQKAQHTPGPWAFTEGNAEKRAMSNIHKADDEEFQIGYVTCEQQNPHQRAEDVANARLIAAAPELLAALREIEDWANDGFRVALRPDQQAKIRAALAKATQ